MWALVDHNIIFAKHCKKRMLLEETTNMTLRDIKKAKDGDKIHIETDLTECICIKYHENGVLRIADTKITDHKWYVLQYIPNIIMKEY